MKVLSAILKLIAALAFIAGVVYLVATYGDKIVAWAKKLLPCKGCKIELTVETENDAEEVVAAEEAPAEEAAEEAAAEEAPVAEENDFEG